MAVLIEDARGRRTRLEHRREAADVSQLVRHALVSRRGDERGAGGLAQAVLALWLVDAPALMRDDVLAILGSLPVVVYAAAPSSVLAVPPSYSVCVVDGHTRAARPMTYPGARPYGRFVAGRLTRGAVTVSRGPSHGAALNRARPLARRRRRSVHMAQA